ncbi:MAG: dihydropteroate synthase [Bacteroidota bacterium]
MLTAQATLNCGGQLLTLDRPRVMGVLNITPDSFYAGSRQESVHSALLTATQMLADGADILDIGGMSSRPGADLITSAEEQARVLPVVAAIKEKFPEAIISIDTVYAATARAAVAEGAGIINDISAGSIDPALLEMLPELSVPYVLMHMRGTPKDMQKQTNYGDVVTEIWDFLAQRNAQLTEAGVNDIILDPGFGFGKTIPQNYHLLNHLHAFRTINRPVLAGISRKSMIWRALEVEPAAALNGTTALHVIALQQGAAILRVHDIKPAVEVVKLHQLIQENK